MMKRILFSVFVIFCSSNIWAVDGIWNYNGSDNWTTSSRWNGSQIASGTDGIADFSRVNIDSGTRTVTLNGNRTIGTVLFGDFMWLSNDWVLQRAGNLTLDVTSGLPVINISNRTTTITAVIDGNDGLEKRGLGTLVLAATNLFTGPVVLNGGQTTLDFSGSLSPTNNIIGSGSALTLTGGSTLIIKGKNSVVNSQTFDGMTLDNGLNFVTVTNGSGGTANLNLGTITRNLGLVDFNLPYNGSITTLTPNEDGILGCYATVRSNDWARNNGFNVVAPYMAYSTNVFIAGYNSIITLNCTMTNAMVNSLRFNDSTTRTLSLTGTNRIVSGGLMFTASSAVGSKINGGWLTSGTNELIIIDNHKVDRRSGLTNTNLDTIITDRGATSVVLRLVSYSGAMGSQNGSLITLARTNNTYSGGTYLNNAGVYFYGDGSFGPVPSTPQTNITAVSGFNWLKPRNAMTTDVNRTFYINTNAFMVFDTRNSSLTIKGAITGPGVLLGPTGVTGYPLVLDGSNTITGTIEANTTALRMTNSASLPATANLRLAGWRDSWDQGIVEMNGTFTRDLGFGANQVAWMSSIYSSDYRSGGFAAVGGPLTVNIGGNGSNLVWSQNYFSPYNYFQLGNVNSTDPVIWVNPINLNSINGGRRINVRGTAIMQGVISGIDCEIIKSAPGNLILAATNSYAFTRIEQGTITIFSDGSIGAVPFVPTNSIRFNYGNGALLAGADLVLGNTRNIWIANNYVGTLDSSNYVMTVSGVVNGQGGLGKAGAGQVVLLNENTYAGPTLISNGTLVVNGSLHSDSIVTVTNTGFIGGSGVVNGPVTVLSGSGLVPGGTNSGGILTLNNFLTMNSGSIYGWRYGTTPGLVAVSNQVTLTPGGECTLRLYNPEGLTEPVNQQFVIMTWPVGVADPDTNITWNIEKPVGGGAEGWAMPVVSMDTTSNRMLVTFPAAGFPAVNNGIGPSDVLTNTAVLNGSYTSTGSTAEVCIYWGVSDGGTNKATWENVYSNGVTSVGDFSTALSNLYYGLRYYYRCYASNAVGECWSPVSSSFTTMMPGLYLFGLRGSLFLNDRQNANALNLNDAAYNISSYRVFTGYKVNSVLALAEAPQYNTIATGDIYNFSMFTGFPSSDYFATVFSGQMVPRFSGVHNFRWDCDDWGMIYIDFNNDGIFQASDGVVAAPIRSTSGNVTLTAGQAYNIIFLGKENAGGESINFWITEPGQPEARVSVILQPGMWKYCQAGAGVSNSFPSSIEATSAVFNAVLSSSGTVSEVWAYWGPADCTNVASAWANSAYLGSFTNVVTNLSYSVTGLTPDIPYYVRFSVTNVLLTSWSDPVSFRTAYQPLADTIQASPFRTKITFSGYDKAETLTNLPVLVVLSESMTNFLYSQFASSSGADLRFTDETQTNELSYEIEQWNPIRFAGLPSGLALWLKADVGVVTNGSGNVTTWQDQSGWGRDANNVISDPALLTNGPAGQNVVNFDGGDAVYTTYNFDSLQQYTIFSVARYTGPDYYGRVISSFTRNDLFGFHSNGDERWHMEGWIYNGGTANTNWHLHAGTINNESDPKANFWKEGNQLAFNANGSSDSYFKPGRVEVGGWNGASEMSKCEVAELIIFDHVLTSNELNQVGGYLSQKYGLPSAYSATTGASYVWVKIPEFTNNCSIWAYWGNTNAVVSPVYTTNGSVWSEGYIGVWHMDRTNTLDSTSNHWNATEWFFPRESTSTGFVGSAQTFNGSSSFMGVGPIRVASEISVEAWAYSGNFGQNGFIVSKQPVDLRWQLFLEGSSVRWSGSSEEITASAPANNAWHYLSGMQSGSDAYLYVDGIQQASGSISSIEDGSGYVEIGRYNSGSYFNGLLDEVRLSSVMRSSNWMWACWLNHASNSSFGICQPVVGIQNLAATNISSTSAVLNATLGTTGLATDVIAYWGANDGGTNPASWASSNFVGSFSDLYTNLSCVATGLAAGVDYLYTFRAVSTESDIWASGIKSFRTLAGMSGFSNKMRITFSGYDRDETLTNFPALVTLGESLPSFLYSQFLEGATDLRFMDAGETRELNYEIESWNTNGSSYIWVQIPEFTSNCSIWAYWGNPSATVAPVCTTNSAAWDSNYRGVWHMKEADALDSTWLKNNGTGYGNTNVMGGKIGNAQGFDNNYVQIANENNFDINDKLTVSAWVRVDNGWRTTWQTVVSKDGEGEGWQLRRYNNLDAASFTMRGTGGDDNGPIGMAGLNDGQWHYLFGVFDGVNRSFYVDGIGDINLADTGYISLDNEPVRIGANNGAGNRHRGIIDEVRIENTARSSNWMWACWLNQASNSFFNTYSLLGEIKNVSASGVTATSAVFNATLYASNTEFDVSVCWDTNNWGTNVTLWAHTNYVGSWTNVDVTSISCTVSGLVSDARYYYTFVATNTTDSLQGDDAQSFRTLFSTESVATYPYRMQITFSGYDKDETLTNFPALVVLTDGYNGFFYNQLQSGGVDLRFTGESTNELNYEIESWNTNGSSYIWVQVPELTNNCSIWAYWGNASVSVPEYTTNGATWNTDFMGVWHLHSNASDSTVNNYDGLVYGGANSLPMEGLIGNAWYFDGLDNAVRVTRMIQADFTIACWMKADGGSINGTQWYNGTGLIDAYVASSTYDFGMGFDSNKVSFGTGNPDQTLLSCVQVNDGLWHHVVATRERLSGAKRVYVDGVDCGTLTGNTNFLNVAGTIAFGQLQTWANYFKGRLDEVEISGITRSSNWIWACYMNQASNSVFNPAGAVEGVLLPYVSNSNGASAVLLNSATLNGYLVATGNAPTTVWVYWGTTDGGTNKLDWGTDGTFGEVGVGLLTTNITGLASATEYYYRFYASNSNGECWAPATESFSTLRYRTKIQFGGYNKDEILTNFPALVMFTEGLNGFSHSQCAANNGGDLRFADSNEMVILNHEIEKWDTGGSSYAWVQVPELVSNGWVWAYWGGLDTNMPSYATNGATWSQNYLGVWHFGSTNSFYKYPDSTASRFDGVNYGGDSIQGKVGGAVDFSGGFKYVDIGGIGSSSSNYTFQYWLQTSLPNGYLTDIANGRIITRMENGTIRTYDSAGSWRTAYGSGLNNGQWRHAVFVFDCDTSTGAIYIDGVLAGSGITYKPTTIGGNARIGCDVSSAAWNHFFGAIDEFQISTVVRSSNWVWACYMNQGSNGWFNTVNPIESTSLPVINNSGAASLTMTSASVGGYLSSTGGAPATVMVYWGTTDGGTNKVAWLNSIDMGQPVPGSLSTNITGLAAGSTYYYRYYASNSFGECWAPASTSFSPTRHQLKIQFSGYDKEETLTNFPVLVTFADGSNGFSYSQMSSQIGGDLRFMNSNETVYLNYEIEQWDPASLSNMVPSDVSGLVLWLKADAGVQTNVDGYVSSWTDQSGAGVNVSQSAGGYQPIYVTNTINGLPAVRFDGFNDQMTWPSALAARTIFVVNRVAVGSKQYCGVIGFNGNDMGIRRENSTTWRHSGSSSDFSNPAGSAFKINGQATTIMAEDVWHVITAVRGIGTMSVDSIGSYYAGREFGGDYAEVLVYNRDLSVNEQNRIGWYLAQKYGLNTTYTQPTGESYIWVQVPELVSNGCIWAYWGGLDTNPPACTTDGSTWDTSYKGVWHMNQPYAKDSTTNANNGIPVGAMDEQGKIDGAQWFNGSSYINCGTGPSLNLPTMLTVESWLKPSSVSGEKSMVGKSGAMIFKTSGTEIRFTTPAVLDHSSSGAGLATGTWYHLACSFEESTLDGCKFYKNGNFLTASNSSALTGNNNAFQIGGYTEYGNGVIDEVRISDIIRSPNWLWASYMNQVSNSSFMSASLFISNESATNLAATSATMRGYLHHTDSVPTYAWIFYGQTDGGSVATNWQNTNYLGEVSEGLISTNISSLQSEKVYYYRYYASNSVRSAWATPCEKFFTGQITVHATDADASEVGPDTGTFTVYRSALETNSALTVNYLIEGTATSGSDYMTLSGAVTIPVGQTNAAITIIPIEDILSESAETVDLTLTAGNYAIGTASNAIVTIQDARINTWMNRMRITFTGYVNEAGEVLTNFPALVVLNTNITGFAYESFTLPDNGGDLRFGNSNETTILNYEIEHWDTNGNSYIWVQVPELADSNTYIWVCWGNSMVTSAPSYTTNGSTWSQDFAGVWHLKEGGGPAAQDSTVNFNHGTLVNSPAWTNGQVNGTLDFDGNTQYVNAGSGSSLSFTNNFTLSAWINPTSYHTVGYFGLMNGILGRGPAGTFNYSLQAKDATTISFIKRTGVEGLQFYNFTGVPTLTTNWTLVTVRILDGTAMLYINGVFSGSMAVGPIAPVAGDVLYLGTEMPGQSECAFAGSLDEIRIRSIAESSNWVWACWMNQASNSAFMSCGGISYTINASANPPTGGTITPSGAVQVANGSDTNFVISVTNAHYHIADVVVDGISVGPSNTYSFSNITNAHTIVANFALDTYTLAVDTLYGFAIPAAGVTTNDWNTNINATVTTPVLNGADTQYVCIGWTGSGSVTNGTGTNTSFNITNDSAISWLWTTNYMLTIGTTNCSVSVTSGFHAADSNVTVTVTPDVNYHFVAWTGATNGCTTNAFDITLPMTNARSITAVCAITTYNINASSGPNGVISPNGVIPVASGSSTNFVMTPATFYHVNDVLVDSVSVGASNSYLFVNVTNNRTVSVTFSPDYTASAHSTPVWWLDQYYGSVDYNAYAEMDTDADGFLSWQEYICGTDPTNNASSFRIIQFVRLGTTNRIAWLGGDTNLPPFEIRRSTNLLSTTNWISITNIVRSADGTNYLNDTSPFPTNLPTFYRIVATNTP